MARAQVVRAVTAARGPFGAAIQRLANGWIERGVAALACCAVFGAVGADGLRHAARAVAATADGRDDGEAKGTDAAALLLWYSAEEAPLGLHTDAVRFEIVKDPNKPGGAPLQSITVPYDRWWLRPDVRLFALTAESSVNTAVRTRVKMQVDGGSWIDEAPPLAVPVPVGVKVVVRAQESVEVLDPNDPMASVTARFAGWVQNGKVVAREPEADFIIADNSA
ncbi:MAG TPA: hypothetical protein VFF06_00050, partial [Polyangia bacterium]|nr:hypothetical protein [Polyangia bacterium]